MGKNNSFANLVKSDDIYKLVISEKVENKIRYMCSFCPNNEWSGVLFYHTSGEFNNKDNPFTAYADDFCVCDVGSSAYTEFEMRPEVVTYMVDNDLVGKYMGLIHSHDTMSTFLSGTDTSTLQSEGSSMPHFLSLIVNDAGKYTAAITRQVERVFTGNVYENFPSFDGKVTTSSPSESKITQKKIVYHMLDIVSGANEDCKYCKGAYESILATKSAVNKSSGYLGSGKLMQGELFPSDWYSKSLKDGKKEVSKREDKSVAWEDDDDAGLHSLAEDVLSDTIAEILFDRFDVIVDGSEPLSVLMNILDKYCGKDRPFTLDKYIESTLTDNIISKIDENQPEGDYLEWSDELCEECINVLKPYNSLSIGTFLLKCLGDIIDE